MWKKMKNKHVLIFYGIMLLDILFLMAWGMGYKGEPFAGFLWWDSADTFMDFFNSVWDTKKFRPYDNGCIYPAFTYLIYGFFRLFVPDEVLQNSAKALRASHEGEFAFMLYMIFAVAFFLYVLFRVKKGRTREKAIFAFGILGSAPFLYMIDRGNNIIICLAFMMVYSFYYDSDILWKRNLALVSLGMAASLKIYPAIFGVILLKEKRWKDAIKCIFFAILLFVLPFLFFGGLGEIGVMVKNIVSTSETFAANSFTYKVNVGNTAAHFVSVLGYGPRGQGVASSVMSVLLLLIAIGLFFFCESKWKQIAILACLMVLVPSFSYTYNILYLVIPLIFFLDKEYEGKMDILYAILFAFSFMPVVFQGKIFLADENGVMNNLLGTIIESYSILGILGLILLETIFEIKNKKQKNGDNDEKNKCISTVL